MASNIPSYLDLYFSYKFLRILTQSWEDMPAFKLGIIDAEGNILKHRKDLTTQEEKNAFTQFNLLVWNIKKILNKLPLGKSKLASFATALYLLKEHVVELGASGKKFENAISQIQEHQMKSFKQLNSNISKLMNDEAFNKIIESEDDKLLNHEATALNHFRDGALSHPAKSPRHKSFVGLANKGYFKSEPDNLRNGYVRFSLTDKGRAKIASWDKPKKVSNEVKEEAAVNVVGGAIAGAGDDEPPVKKEQQPRRAIMRRRYMKHARSDQMIAIPQINTSKTWDNEDDDLNDDQDNQESSN